MSRGGANPNWEYQLISPKGHTSDEGLRQRAMVLRGHIPPQKSHEAKLRTSRAKKRKVKAMNLAALFTKEKACDSKT